MERKGIAVLLLLLSLSWTLGGQVFDGAIGTGEYPMSAEYDGGRFRLYWRLEGDVAYYGISADTVGWVSIGFEPKMVMAEADMVFGWIDDGGKLNIVDAYSQDTYGPHPPDETLGGTSDVLESGGSEAEGITIFEFSRRLSTGDKFDKDIPADGELKIIWAYSESDIFDDFHIRAGFGSLNMASGAAPAPAVNFLLVHIILMSLSVLLITAGMLIARYMKKRKWWLKAHRPMGITGSALGVAGLAVAFVMVSMGSAVHLRVAHSWLGLFTVLALIMTPVTGLVVVNIKSLKQERRKQLRMIHRWLGRLAILMMLLTILSGLRQAGIL